MKVNWLANSSSSKSVIQIKLNAPIDIDMLEKLFSFSLLKLEGIVLAYRDFFLHISIAIDSLFQKTLIAAKIRGINSLHLNYTEFELEFLVKHCLIAIIQQ